MDHTCYYELKVIHIIRDSLYFMCGLRTIVAHTWCNLRKRIFLFWDKYSTHYISFHAKKSLVPYVCFSTHDIVGSKMVCVKVNNTNQTYCGILKTTLGHNNRCEIYLFIVRANIRNNWDSWLPDILEIKPLLIEEHFGWVGWGGHFLGHLNDFCP